MYREWCWWTVSNEHGDSYENTETCMTLDIFYDKNEYKLFLLKRKRYCDQMKVKENFWNGRENVGDYFLVLCYIYSKMH